jgi:inorganic pyrophosphatase
VNNDIGYTIDNVVSCCIDCNIKKHATTKNIAKKMINFINKSKHKDLVVIEISTNDVYKYEIDKDTGVLILDRPLNQAIPTNYGYYNLTLQKDGDALDIFVISKYPIKNTAYITPKIIGAYVCKDNEIQDDKLVAILNDEKLDNNFTNNKLKEIRSYLETYKANFKVLEFVGKSEAEEILYQAKEMYKLSTCLTYNK